MQWSWEEWLRIWMDVSNSGNLENVNRVRKRIMQDWMMGRLPGHLAHFDLKDFRKT